MKNKITILSALFFLNIFFCSTAEAQWVKRYYVDDFGDKTDQSYESFSTKGTFSNSATDNSEASYTFIKDDETLIINVYEYGSKLASEIDATFETVKIKQPDGNVVTIEKVFFTKSGKLFFNKASYTSVIEAMSKIGNYTMLFKRTGKYNDSTYKIKFSIE